MSGAGVRTTPGDGSRAGGRDWVLFAGWAVTGGAGLLALLSLMTVGVFVLPAALVGAVVLATRRGTERGLPGLLSGLGLPLLLLTYLNRQGPGTYCTSSGTGQTCTEGLYDPWLLLALALLALAGGLVLFLRGRRAR